MSDTRKYLVARGPFRIPTPAIEEGAIVELDSAVAAQFVREGTLNPSGFECDDAGNPVVETPPAGDTTPPSDVPPADVPPTDQLPADQPPAGDTTPPSEGAPAKDGE